MEHSGSVAVVIDNLFHGLVKVRSGDLITIALVTMGDNRCNKCVFVKESNEISFD